ncbi:MAG: phosphatase PAP2 family protein [Erysipelotrichales bacterium]|nr:phosphatase PAP2 family protein [Erysipelotrichales bacterium]
MRIYKKKLIVITSLLLAFTIVTIIVLSGIFETWEFNVGDDINYFIDNQITFIFMRIITFAGDFFVLLGAVLLLFIIPKTRKKIGLPLGFALLASAATNQILKNIFRRERHPGFNLIETSGFSFPSGHTQNSTVFFVMLILLLFYAFGIRKKIIFIAIATIPFIVGISRIYLGAHYLGDIIASFLIGPAIALTAFIIWDLLREKSKGTKLHQRLFVDKTKYKNIKRHR